MATSKKARRKQKREKPTVATAPWETRPLTRTAGLNSVVEAAVYLDPETGKKINPNGVTRRRRVSWLEVYKSRGLLTDRQVRAGLAIQEAFERTQGSSPAIKKVQVDSSPKPDHAIEMILKRIGDYHAVARLVPKAHAVHIDHVAVQNAPLTSMKGCRGPAVHRYMKRLSDGLNGLADNLAL